MKVSIVVTGGRDYHDRQHVFDVLERYTEAATSVRLAHGGAAGADSLADAWGRDDLRTEVVVYPADWQTHGRSAGPMRNHYMLEAERPMMVIAFPGGRGTDNCVAHARNLGLTVVDFRRHR